MNLSQRLCLTLSILFAFSGLSNAQEYHVLNSSFVLGKIDWGTGTGQVNWPAGSNSFTATNVQNTGHNFTFSVSDPSGALNYDVANLSSMPPYVADWGHATKSEERAVFATNGIGAGNSVVITIDISPAINGELGFDIYHFNTTGNHGDHITVTARDVDGTTVNAFYTGATNPSWQVSTTNPAEVDAIGYAGAGDQDQLGVNISSAKKINRITMVWEDCNSCTTPDLHAFSFGDIEFSNDLDTDKDGVIDAIDIDADNDGITDLFEACRGVTSDSVDFEIVINLDNYPQEVDWDLRNSSGAIIQSDGPYANPADNGATKTYTYRLEKGDYVFNINDSYGDGLCCPSPGGSYELRQDGKTIVGPILGNFGSLGSHALSLDVEGYMCAGGNPFVDDDSDGIVNYKDNDFCILNANGVCNDLDQDGDGIIDLLDLDSDNDGIPDLVEAGGTDTNGDGLVDNAIDSDDDGMIDLYDNNDTDGPGGSAACSDQPDCVIDQSTSILFDTNGDGTNDSFVDFDGDGISDYLDLDADNDGIPDIVEAGGVDVDGDGFVDNYDASTGSFTGVGDMDNDGFSNIYDDDTNNDGTDGDANPLVETGADTNNDGQPNSYPMGDMDGDGNLDYVDLDADNDGIPDVVEAGGVDVDGDGFVDNYDASTGSFTGVGDTDNDGFSNVYDDDTNNDGTDGDANPLVETGADTNNDGRPNSYPMGDMDGDGNLDYVDLDADNDGIPDIVEAGGVDVDGDGFVDNYDASTGSFTGVGDTDNDGFSNVYDDDTNNDGTDGDANPLVETGADTNNDGRPNSYPMGDMDGDGNLDYVDLDADNDGIPDVVEAGGVDVDGDGFVDNYDASTGSFTGVGDTDNDGFSNIYDDDTNNDGTDGDANPLVETGADTNNDGRPNSYPMGDRDEDGRLNHLDLDGDNDGIPDLVEAGGADDNSDGFVDNYDASTGSFTGVGDTDNDGFSNVYDDDTNNDGTDGDANPLVETGVDTNNDGRPNSYPNKDFDQDGILNQWDLDADNDGIVDIIEAGGNDSNGDAMVDDYNIGNPTTFDTADNDGWSPSFDGDAANDGSTTTTGDGTSLILTDDTNNDGFPNSFTLGDTEEDTYPDFLDIDADNDGIVDNVEAQTTAGYTLPVAGPSGDSDGDGLNNAYDNMIGFGGTGIETDGLDSEGTPNDEDGDSIPDYLDPDTDNDNIPDIQEAWDDLVDGDSRVDVLNCDGSDVDKDGLLDCFDSDTNNPTVTSYVSPISDNGNNGGSTVASATTSGDKPDDIFPDNGGQDAEADWREVHHNCNTPQVYYAITEKESTVTTDYEYNPNDNKHENNADTKIIRATVYCEPDADGWYYYYNPLESNNYLFAIKNNDASPNTVPMYEIIDYIEIKLEGAPVNRHVIGTTEATLVMERDWNVVFKGTPDAGSSFDIKFYFQAIEMERLDDAAAEIMANSTGGNRSALQWFKKPGGLNNSDISEAGVANMSDISAMNLVRVDETNTGLTDGSNATTGNGKNYVEFTGLTSFSGGTAMIRINYAALPVELSKFDGVEVGCQTLLNWRTETEEDFSHFELERSGDGRNFSTIKKIAATGGKTARDYQYFDKNAQAKNYYRLRMVDLDGSFDLSDIIFVGTSCTDVKTTMELYPNPISSAVSNLNVKFYTKDTEANFTIVDILGRPVRSLNLSVEKGWNTISLDTSDLAAGTYFIYNSASLTGRAYKFEKINL